MIEDWRIGSIPTALVHARARYTHRACTPALTSRFENIACVHADQRRPSTSSASLTASHTDMRGPYTHLHVHVHRPINGPGIENHTNTHDHSHDLSNEQHPCTHSCTDRYMGPVNLGRNAHTSSRKRTSAPLASGQQISACLYACVSACLPACLFSVPAQPAGPPVRPSVRLPVCPRACIPPCPPGWLGGQA